MSAPSLRRELGLFDLTLLLLVAIVNINILPRIAGEGWVSLSLWILAFLLFLIPTGIAVAFFGRKYPGEGGIYVWTRECFGDFHAFLSGWCYWTCNLYYYPSMLFILIGVAVYAGGASSASLAQNNNLVAVLSLGLLWMITLMHVRGLGVGKWLNNFGAAASWIAFAILVLIALAIFSRNGAPGAEFHAGDLIPSFSNYNGFSAFSIVMYSLVGLELGSVMGDEIRDTTKIIRKALFLASVFSIALYLLGTASLLIALPSAKVGAVQGMMQAITAGTTLFRLESLIPIIAIVNALAILGTCSAWMSGAARIPFVMGVGVYLPPSLGKTHPKWDTPHVALLVQAVLSSILILLSLYGANVAEAYEKLLSSSVAIQLIPFLYLFAGLWKLHHQRFWAAVGFVTTAFGVLFVFVPSSEITNRTRFLMEVFGSFSLMILIAVGFYVIALRKRKLATA